MEQTGDIKVGREKYNPLLDVCFDIDDEPTDPNAQKKIDWLASRAQDEGIQIDPKVSEYFKDPAFFNSLPASIRDDEEVLFAYLKNSSQFDDLISPERQKAPSKPGEGLLGEDVVINEGAHADGRPRRVEEGYLVQVDYLNQINIDPTKVLVFRVTQPSDSPKPEYYWTTDLFETKRGLQREIRPEQRQTSVILVSSLDAISKNGGLIQDMNDDNGMSFRQIGITEFDQNDCVSIIKNSNE